MDGGVPRIDAGAPVASDELLCPGGSALRLLAVRTAAGMPAPGSEVLVDNGAQFLLVQGDCRFWAFAGGLAHVKTGPLSAGQQEALVSALRLDAWEQWVGDYHTVGRFDYPAVLVAFGQQNIDLPCAMSASAGTGCASITSGSVDTFAQVEWLEAAVTAQIAVLSQAGAVSEGDIRYSLVEGTRFGAPQIWQTAAAWPLGDPAAVALTTEEASAQSPADRTLATGADADALRQVWNGFLAGSVGSRSFGDVIPIEVDAMRYELWLRDVIPLEGDDGMLPLFAPRP